MFEDTRAEPQICNLANLRDLSNANLLAKIGVDTAENEPCKDLQEVCKILQDLHLQLFLQKVFQKLFSKKLRAKRAPLRHPLGTQQRKRSARWKILKKSEPKKV